VLIAVVLS